MEVDVMTDICFVMGLIRMFPQALYIHSSTTYTLDMVKLKINSKTIIVKSEFPLRFDQPNIFIKTYTSGSFTVGNNY